MTETKKELTQFEKLCERDVSKYTEKKNGLTHVPNLYQNKVITLWLSNKT